MTLESLKAYGANTDEGLNRCMNNEAFYLRMVGMALEDRNFDALETAVKAEDARAAFEAAHALKGSIGNLSLTPIYTPISALVELVRGPGGRIEAVRADAAIDVAVRERRIGESARETWKTRLVNEGAPAYAALANEKPLPTRDASKGLANECGEQTDSEKRKAMVNEIMTSEKVDYDTAWQRAARRSPELFK